LGIGKDGTWRFCSDKKEVEKCKNTENDFLDIGADWPTVLLQSRGNKPGFYFPKSDERINFDIAFPILHGPNGEDGRIQGFFELMHIPFTGSDMYSSALCMDKACMKDYFRKHRIPQVKYFWFFLSDFTKKPAKIHKNIQKLKASGIYIKPSRMGSSIGISRIDFSDNQEQDLKTINDAVMLAGSFDEKIVIEEKITDVTELEFSVLGNKKPKSAGPGEIQASDEFYSYDAKYVSADGANLNLESTLDIKQVRKFKRIALKAYTLAGCSGFARVDGFLSPEKNFFINEINTLPGFTSISMYPKLWELQGVKMSTLLDKIVKLGFEQFERKPKRDFL
jgi:D-alanine-D-alanine ligase